MGLSDETVEGLRITGQYITNVATGQYITNVVY